MDLVLEKLTVAFGRHRALDDLSLTVGPGERVAIIGSSGAGKSTLFRALTRGVPATGKVRLGGEEVYLLPRKRLTALRRKIGTIRQAYDLVPQLSAGMNVALGEVGGMGFFGSLEMFARGPKPDLSGRVEEALARVGLAKNVRSKASDLSGGQQQRVAVARLLVQRPGIILADEPFSAVDPVTTRRVLDALLALNGDGATLIVNLHDVELARSFPRVVALRDGKLAYDGPPDGLTDRELRRIYAGDPSRIKARSEPQEHPGPETPVTKGMDGVAAH